MARPRRVWNAAIGSGAVEFYDAKGHRTGYALVDRERGRVDFYDVKSCRTGWGRLDPQTGRAERFGLDGRRQADTAVPIWPLRPDEGTKPGRP